MNPATHDAGGDSEMLCHFGEAPCHPSNRYDAIVSLVSILLRWCRPVAIVFGIPGVVVSALYRSPNRALAHIGKEIGEFKPPLAHRYSTATVLWIWFALWFGASLNNAAPTVEGFGSFGAAVAVNGASSLNQFDVKAPARFIISSGQSVIPDNHFIAAVTDANAGAVGAVFSLDGLAFCDDQKPCEPRPDGESFSWHSDVFLEHCCIASGGLSAETEARCEFCSPSLNSSTTV